MLVEVCDQRVVWAALVARPEGLLAKADAIEWLLCAPAAVGQFFGVGVGAGDLLDMALAATGEIGGAGMALRIVGANVDCIAFFKAAHLGPCSCQRFSTSAILAASSSAVKRPFSVKIWASERVQRS